MSGPASRKYPCMALLLACSLALPATARQQEKPDTPKRIHIIAERFSFTPSRVKIKEGTTVELVIRSEDTTHGFRIPELGIDVLVSPREEVHVVIEAREKGQYDFECSRPCGAGHNAMRGVLIIE